LSTRKPWWLLGLAAVAPFATAVHAQSRGGLQQLSGAGKAASHISGHNASALDQAIPVGFTARAVGVYDSNVARSRVTFGPDHIVKQDEIFEPAVLANLQKTFGREALFLNGTAGYDIYRVNTFLNHQRVDIEGGGSTPVGPCKAQLSGDYQNHRTDLADLNVPNGLVNNVENHETVSVQGDCSQLVGLAPEASFSDGWVQNSADVRKSVNRNVISAEGGIGYTRPTLGEITIFGQYEDAKFPNLVIAGVHDAYTAKIGGIRYTRKLGARIEGEVELSYEKLNPSLPGAAGFSGITYSLDLTYKASAKLESHFIFSRRNNPSNRAGATFSTDDLYSGDITYLLGGRLKLEVGGEYRRRAYGDTNLFGGRTLALEHIYTVQSELTYDMSQRLEWALRYEREQRTANVTQFDYVSDRVTLQLDVKL
jgi:hypothetical protein